MARAEINVKVSDLDAVKDLIAELTARTKRAELLVRSVDLFGTGFIWKRPDGTEHVLDPTEVVMVIAADQQSEREQLTARAERPEERSDELSKAVSEKISDWDANEPEAVAALRAEQGWRPPERSDEGPKVAVVLNPEAVGDPTQTPRVYIGPMEQP